MSPQGAVLSHYSIGVSVHVHIRHINGLGVLVLRAQFKCLVLALKSLISKVKQVLRNFTWRKSGSSSARRYAAERAALR